MECTSRTTAPVTNPGKLPPQEIFQCITAINKFKQQQRMPILNPNKHFWDILEKRLQLCHPLPVI